MKKFILSILIVLLGSTLVFPQQHAVDKGAVILSGMGSFTSMGVEDADNRTTTISFVPIL